MNLIQSQYYSILSINFCEKWKSPTAPKIRPAPKSKWFSSETTPPAKPPSSTDFSPINSTRNAVQATVGIDFLAKNVYLTKSIIRLQLWDTAGQERFRSLIPNYLRDARIAILVFDVGNRGTFQNLGEWFQLFKQNKHPNANIVLVGNKIDLPRAISTEEGVKKAELLGMRYFQVSAKTAVNIQTLFNEVASIFADENLRESNILDTSSKIATNEPPKEEKITLQQKLPYQETQRKKGCCYG